MVIKWYWKVFEKCWLFFFGQSCCNSSNPGCWYKRNQNFWLSRWIGIYLVQEHVIKNHGISKSNLHELFTCHFFIHWSYFALVVSSVICWVEISAVTWTNSQFSPTMSWMYSRLHFLLHKSSAIQDVGTFYRQWIVLIDG